MSERAIELLALQEGDQQNLLDIGCGSGLSGEVLSEMGHIWTGIDISPSMLQVARESGCEGDLIECDIGQALPFRPGSFDGAISISTVQWLCSAFKKAHNPKHRIHVFFQSLYSCLRKGARAVIQLYPADKHQLDLLTTAAMRSGFTGGLVVDYPNSTKAKKIYLVLFCGASNMPLPRALGTDEEARGPRTQVQVGKRRRQAGRSKRKGKRDFIKTKDWVKAKKERRKAQGKSTAKDSKYTARKRGPRF